MELRSTEEETAELLSRVLDGNVPASEALAKVVHQDVDLTDPTLESLEIRVPQDILGVWVDPIGKCGAPTHLCLSVLEGSGRLQEIEIIRTK